MLLPARSCLAQCGDCLHLPRWHRGRTWIERGSDSGTSMSRGTEDYKGCYFDISSLVSGFSLGGDHYQIS